MKRVLKGSVALALVAGLAVGAVALIGAQQAYHYSSSDEFCSTSCHSMDAYVANETHYVQSSHRTPSTGVQAGCSDCHMPPTFPDNIIYKITSGTRDIYREFTSDFSDPRSWEQRREVLAHRVRDWFIETDSASCRSCHTAEVLKPTRERGQRQHELAQRARVTCIGCHYDLVHAPVPRTLEFERYAHVEADMTRGERRN
ncbi:MAG: hypothetical protein GWN09_02065 [Gammaproteobacteria bacterium]|nr:hypothetical protein [Gammaproteobacteria bacterium]